MIPDDFGYGEEQVALRRTARKWLESACATPTVRKLMETPSGWDEAMWKQMAELGWLELGELSLVTQATILEEMGRALLPSPYLGTLHAALLLRDAGDTARLERIARGELRAAVAATEEQGGWDPSVVATTARADGGGFVLEGRKPLVLDAPAAGLFLVTAREGDAISLFAVPADQVKVSPDTLVDATRRSGLVELRGARVGADARVGAPGTGLAALGRALPRLLVALAAESIGGAERVFQITLAYAKVREQFDRPIGAFQAVKHPLVNVMTDIEMGRSLVYRAAAAIDAGDAAATRLAHMAKAYVSDVYANAVAKAVQLHGGIGFTWECDVHLWFKRAQWSKAAFGDAAHHRRVVSELLLAR